MNAESASCVAVSEPTARPAFATVAEGALNPVYRYLLHLVGDPHQAEDLTSATFERALRRWGTFDPARGEPLPWLLAMARSVALDHFRADGRRGRREERYVAGEPVVGEDRPAGGLSGDLAAALGRLSRSERELIALRVVLELDTDEAARVAGVSASSVSSGLHRALTKLRREVARDEA